VRGCLTVDAAPVVVQLERARQRFDGSRERDRGRGMADACRVSRHVSLVVYHSHRDTLPG